MVPLTQDEPGCVGVPITKDLLEESLAVFSLPPE